MIILHGEDTVRSYQRLSQLIELCQKRGEVIIYDYQDLTPSLLRQETGSSSLFSAQKCLVIKNLLKAQKSKTKDLLQKIIDQSGLREIILWENDALSPSVLRTFPSAKIETFPLSPQIFKFLDCLHPGQTSVILLAWKNLLTDKVEPEFVFSMLVRQFKLLIQAKDNPSLLKLAPYPAKLIKAQANHFDLGHLLDLYHHLFRIDLKIKTGLSSVSLEHLLGHFFQKI